MRDVNTIDQYINNITIKEFYTEYLSSVEEFKTSNQDILPLIKYLLNVNYLDLIQNLKCLTILSTDNLDAFLEDFFNKIVPILEYMQKNGYQYDIDNKRYPLLLLLFPMSFFTAVHFHILDDDSEAIQRIKNKLESIDNTLYQGFPEIYTLFNNHYLIMLNIKYFDISLILSNDINIFEKIVVNLCDKLLNQMRNLESNIHLIKNSISMDFFKAVEIYENSTLIEDDLLNLKAIYNIMLLNSFIKNDLIKKYISNMMRWIYFSNRKILNFFQKKNMDQSDKTSLIIDTNDFKTDDILLEKLKLYIKNIQYALYERSFLDRSLNLSTQKLDSLSMVFGLSKGGLIIGYNHSKYL